ncbi:MAG: hypothetical protein ACLFVO_15035 [Chloroflexaceae bacterium]
MDHEHHDMSEKHESAGAAMYQAILHLAGYIAPGKAEHARSFSQKNSQREFFCEKGKSTMLPQAILPCTG